MAKKNELATVKENLPMSAELAAALDADSGIGVSDRIEDNVVPLVYLLQANSKAALKGHDKYVPGAVGGSIWLRNADPSEAVINGEEGMLFLPAFFTTCWIEWMPDRGGFVARHSSQPAEARLTNEPGEDGRMRKVWKMPNGNSVGESREFSGFVCIGDQRLPYTIPLSGSGHQVGKNWMTAIRSQVTPSGKKAPLWGYYWRLKTKLRTVGDHSWYQFEVSKEGPINSLQDRDLAKALNEAFAAGQKQSDVDSSAEDSAATDHEVDAA